MKSIDEMRRQSFLDGLEEMLARAERYKADAYDAGDVDEAVVWHTLAAALRGTVAMVRELGS